MRVSSLIGRFLVFENIFNCNYYPKKKKNLVINFLFAFSKISLVTLFIYKECNQLATAKMKLNYQCPKCMVNYKKL